MGKKKPPISEEVLDWMAQRFRMLGDSTRLAILHALMTRGELSVGEVVAATDRNTANVSKHLKQLAAGGLLARRKEGAFVLYRLSDPVVEKICELMCDSLRSEIESQRKLNRLLDR
ncbi:MAG: ArsR/SmtB family transcription factor [Planctomycetaceae bacterium]